MSKIRIEKPDDAKEQASFDSGNSGTKLNILFKFLLLLSFVLAGACLFLVYQNQ